MSERAHTKGPWGWFGNARTNTIYLVTVHGGRRYVMDFTRWGMRGAQPRFQRERGGMIDAQDLLQFEVGDRSVVGIRQAKDDDSVDRLDIRGIDCPDARLIAAAPDMFELIEDGIPILEAVLEDREEANGEEDEILRDLLDRFRSIREVREPAWQPMETAPKTGARIEVGHTKAPGYVGTGSWAGDRWSCSIAFVAPEWPARLYWQPDIWRPVSVEAETLADATPNPPSCGEDA